MRRQRDRFGEPVKMLRRSTMRSSSPSSWKTQRHLVDAARRRGALMTRVLLDVAEERDLRLDLLLERLRRRGRAGCRAGCRSPVSSFTLCCVGLVLSSPRRRDVRHQRQVDVERRSRGRRPSASWRMASRNGRLSMSPTVPPTSPMQTSKPSAASRMRRFDLVGDVRDHLHRAAEVVAAALLLDHRVVDLAGGEVVLLASSRVET